MLAPATAFQLNTAVFWVILLVVNPLGAPQETPEEVVKFGPLIQPDHVPLLHSTRTCHTYVVALVNPVIVRELVLLLAVVQVLELEGR